MKRNLNKKREEINRNNGAEISIYNTGYWMMVVLDYLTEHSQGLIMERRSIPPPVVVAAAELVHFKS